MWLEQSARNDDRLGEKVTRSSERKDIAKIYWMEIDRGETLRIYPVNEIALSMFQLSFSQSDFIPLLAIFDIYSR